MSGTITKSPNTQQGAAAILEVFAEVYELISWKRPGKLARITSLKKQRDDFVVIARFAQREHQFAFNPHGLQCSWRKYDDKPVTPPQRSTNFIVPLLRPQNLCWRIPNSDAVLLQDCCQPCYKRLIRAGLRKKHLAWQHRLERTNKVD
jgi:hypothetical protein